MAFLNAHAYIYDTWGRLISEVVSVDHGEPERGEWKAAAAPGPAVLLPPVEQSPGELGTGLNAVLNVTEIYR